MKVYSTKKNNFLFVLIFIFISLIIFLLYNTPGFKGDIEQSLRIFFKQPILLKGKKIYENTIYDYYIKLYNSFLNKLTNKTSIEKINIHISFKELEILKKNRSNALKYKKLISRDKVSGLILFNNQRYKAQFRLKGDLSEHWGNVKQWSLKIKLENNKAILGMNEFSITVPTERAFPINYLIYNTLKSHKILTPKYHDFHVKFNGTDWGVMLAEEQVSNTFYAFNELKEAPIIKMTNDLDWDLLSVYRSLQDIENIVHWQGKLENKIYKEKKIRKKTNIPLEKTNQNLISLFSTIQETVILKDKKNIKKVARYLNIEKFAVAEAVTLLFGDVHSKNKYNSRYYVDPYTLKIEPMLADFNPGKLDANYPNDKSVFYQLLQDDERFIKKFNNTLYQLSNEIKNFQKILNKSCKNYGRNCLSEYNIKVFEDNLKLLKKTKTHSPKVIINNQINNNFNTLSKKITDHKKIHYRIYNNGELHLFNLTSEKIYISRVNLINEKNIKTVNLNFYLGPSDNINIFKNIFLIKNIDLSKYTNVILRFSDSDKQYSLAGNIENFLFSPNYLFLKDEKYPNSFKVDSKTYLIPKGSHIFYEPIIIPSGFNLLIEPGAILNMSENTYIKVINGEIKIKGEKNLPIVFKPLDNQKLWNGIYVFSDHKKSISEIQNANFSNLTYYNDGKIKLTGSINLLNSNFFLKNVNISNIFSEDAINAVKSNVNFDNINVTNSNSDAIDFDFVKGSLTNIFLEKVNGDGLDFSGSNIKIRNLYANNIKDKGVSVGEASVVQAQNIKILNSKIGIASKDSSKFEGDNIMIDNSTLFDLAAYIKKKYFNGGFIKIKNSKDFKKVLAQKKSRVILNNKAIETIKYNIKKIY